MNVAGAGRRLVAALRLQGSQGSTRAMSLAMMPRAGLTTSARLMVPTLVCRTIPFRAFSSSNDKGGSGSGSGEGGGSAGTVKEDKPNDDELSDAEVDMPPLIPLVPLRPSRKARKTKSTMVKGEKEHDKEKEKEKEKAKQWFNVPVFYNSVRCKEEDVERALASSMFETWKENMKANVNIFTTCLKIDSVVYIPQTHQAIKYVKMSAIVYTKESYEAYLEYPEREKEREQQRLLHPEEPAKEPVKENEKETKARKEKERNAVLKNIPGICFLRGPRVSVLVVIPTETEEFTVLSVNRRISVAKPAVPELPSGDIDETGDFVGEVADQLKEELEIQIKEMDLVDLTQLAFGTRFILCCVWCGA
eukprot:c12368_g2_i4.p1 GENE.c12368_g2_i4~~c12368_g2_i4.p1  ORF type:complete len:362 (+),score=71.56 c12368_g2_i4:100-1185(+)